ncbi:MAG: phytoene/squalene synthase family protein [Pseudomonadota bacterium]
MSVVDDHCAQLVRTADRDLFLATLFAPEPARQHIFALYAFSCEVAQVRDRVSEPMPGEIRLQWWRDQLESGVTSGHPVADAVIEALKSHDLPSAPLVALTHARIFDLYNDPMPSATDFEGYCGETVSVLFQLGAVMLNGGADPGTSEAAGHAGVAYGIMEALRSLPRHASRHQFFLPADRLAALGGRVDDVFAGIATDALNRLADEMIVLARDHLIKARAALSGTPDTVMPAFLPMALVAPTLDRLAAPGRNALEPFSPHAQWRRQFMLWHASRKALPF